MIEIKVTINSHEISRHYFRILRLNDKEAILIRLGWLVTDFSAIDAFDINPVLVSQAIPLWP